MAAPRGGDNSNSGRCCCCSHRRYGVLVFCFLANVVCFVDRTNIAVAALAIQADYNWTDSDVGVALSSFFYGYAAMQIPSGWLSTRFGGKRVLAVCVAVWSMFTIITPLAIRVSFGTLLAARIGMGLAEAASMPCVHSLIGAWFPPSEVSFAISFSTSGQAVGTIVALMSSPLVSWYWPSVFYFYGVWGIVWTVLFAIFCPAAPTPQDCAASSYAVDLVDTLCDDAPQLGETNTTCCDEDGDNNDDDNDNDNDSGRKVAAHSRTRAAGDLELTVVLRGERRRSSGDAPNLHGGDSRSDSGRDIDSVGDSDSDGGSGGGSNSGGNHSDRGGSGGNDSDGRGGRSNDSGGRAGRGSGRRRSAPDPAPLATPVGSKHRTAGVKGVLQGCVRVTCALCRPSFVAIVVAHMTHNYGYYVTLMWLPAYFTSLGACRR
jgi:uncharacterized membrane protein YgcG